MAATSGGACTGLTVLDLCQGLAGSLATMVLADNGATVIKVEPPTGDPSRSHPAFRMWNRGKQSVVLDLHTAAGRERALRLAATADVVVESFRPGVVERLGVGYGAVAHVNPAVVYCSISGFGAHGPYANYPGYEGVVAAKTGRMLAFAGIAPREGPAFEAVPVASFGAWNAALQGIFAALYVRERTGRGQKIETSLLHGLTAYDLGGFIAWQMAARAGQDPAAAAAAGWAGSVSGMIALTYLVAVTRDGRWIQFANNAPHLFRAFIRALGLEHVYDEPRFAAAPAITDPNDRDALVALLLTRIREKTWAEWEPIFRADTDISAEPFRTTAEGMAHPQMVHNGHVVEVETGRQGRSRQLGPLVRLARTPGRAAGPAPATGEHTEEVLSRLAGTGGAGSVPAPQGSHPLPRHALDGVTVLEFAGYYAAPFGTSLLADLGARVIKVEPLDGDPMRAIGAGDAGRLGVAKTVQGKESLAVNLRTEEGRRIVHALVARADLLMHNYRPGVPERLGLDYATVSAINPRLVYLYAALYGDSGPDHLRPGFHPTAGAVSGGALYQAGAGTPPPPGETPADIDALTPISRRLFRSNEGNPDPSSALVVGTALLLGLYARERTGQGQQMLTTMICSNAYANADDFIAYPGKRPRLDPDADLYGLDPLYRLYRAADGWVFLAAPAIPEWERCARALGREDLLNDPRFIAPEGRAANGDALAGELSALFAREPAAAWEARLIPAGVGCVEVHQGDLPDFLNRDSAVAENGMMVEVEHPEFGRYRRHGPIVHLSATPGAVRSGGPVGGETAAILRELGYGAEQIEQLKSLGVVTYPDGIAESTGE